MVRHEIDYEKPALPGDAISATTWVGEFRAARWARHTQISRESDGAVLVRAVSIWCPLRADSGRPRRVDEALQTPFYR